MADPDDRPDPDPDDMATAGEYVLGTLPLAQRQAFRKRLTTTPALQAEVDRWQSHLDPLADEVRPVQPPERVWRAVQARLFWSDAAGQTAADRGTSVAGSVSAWWRWLGIGSALTAASLALAIVLGPLNTPEAPGLWVSDMVSTDGTVRLAALYDETRGEMRVSVGGQAPAAGRDWELWLIQPDQAPVSLGIMPHQGKAAMPVPAPLRARMTDATLAITDEPSGGAPGGVATGAVIAAAPLRRI